MALEVVTADERPDLATDVAALARERWPEFVFHDPVPHKYMERVHRYFRELRVLLLDEGRAVAGGWGVPFAWDGDPEHLPAGYDGTLVRSVEDHEGGSLANAFSVMAAAVDLRHDRRGLAREVLAALTGRAADARARDVVAPIRPTRKHHYPRVPMREYLRWSREDGLSTDPWIRTHQRMGAQILRVAPDSMVVPGSVADWERWTGMRFPRSGEYVVPGGLNLLRVDRDVDEAVYREENVWVRHRPAPGSAKP